MGIVFQEEEEPVKPKDLQNLILSSNLVSLDIHWLLLDSHEHLGLL